MTDAENLDLIRRVLVLRKLKQIGVIWAECGLFWISDQELDGRLGAKRPISFERLTALVERTEGIERMPPGSSVRLDGQSHIAQKNILSA